MAGCRVISPTWPPVGRSPALVTRADGGRPPRGPAASRLRAWRLAPLALGARGGRYPGALGGGPPSDAGGEPPVIGQREVFDEAGVQRFAAMPQPEVEVDEHVPGIQDRPL